MKKCLTCPRDKLNDFKVCDNCYKLWEQMKRDTRVAVTASYPKQLLGSFNPLIEMKIAELVKMYEDGELEQYNQEIYNLIQQTEHE